MANKIQKLTQSRAEVQRILNESDGLRQQVESELATLKGEGEGSVSAAVEAGVRRVLGGASEAYDTLKEIEDYIEKDEAGAVVLAQNIAKNAKAIEDSPFEKGSAENSAVLKGGNNKAKGAYSFASGLETEASGDYSHAEGYNTTASGQQSHAEGNGNKASGNYSHVEGNSSHAQGPSSHAEGRDTWANGEMAHAEGYSTKAVKNASHTEGVGTVAENNAGEHAEGKYNKSNEGTLHSVGIGSVTARKNAHEIMDSGEHYIYNIGGYDGTNPTDSEDLATAIKNLIEITYTELVNLRNTSKLTSGRLYRITDYITTTIQENTQSAGHPFDIIVLALSKSELSEQAWAVQSARDTDGYFANSKLSAWKIWYRLDNDTSRFAWADETNGKGVIYRVIDEHGNDCPYDFKNIQFKHPNNTTDTTYYYTFSTILSGVVTDHSFNGGYCYGNKIGPRITDGKHQLNVIVFINKSNTAICISNSFGDSCRNNSFGTACYSNTFGNNCHSNSFQDNCRFNSFGDACYSNIFDKSCYGNSFGNYCYSNTFGESCRYNSFENGCYSNTFGESCYYNSLGNDCHSNRFGDTCNSNSLGNTCYSNTFGNSCNSNSLGNTCYSNTFDNLCDGNSFGNKCDHNSLGALCRFNSFGNWCNSNSLVGNCISNSFGNSCYDNRFGSYYKYNKMDDGVSSITLSNSQTAASNQNVQNYHLTHGLSYKTIEVERNRAYQTTVAIDSSGNVKQFCIADIIL